MAAVTGLRGEVDSWSGTFNAATLALITPAEFSLRMTNADLDTTAFVNSANTHAVAKTMIPGLRDWSGSFTGPSVDGSGVASNGIAGSVTGANYSAQVQAWELDLVAAELDSTLFGTSGSWRTFAPGLVEWSGTYDALVDDSTAVALVDDTPVTATFQLRTSNTWVGTIFTTSADVVSRVGELATVRYAFRGSGHLDVNGSAAIMPDNSGALATPVAGSLVLKTYENNGTGERTLTGSAFWTRIRASVRTGEVVKATVDFRGTGALTSA